jgi:hypothetical protein
MTQTLSMLSPSIQRVKGVTHHCANLDTEEKNIKMPLDLKQSRKWSINEGSCEQ